MSKTCKFMLACLVHKDNKDISSKPTKLAPGRSWKNARQEKESAVAEQRAKAKAERPVPSNNMSGMVMLTMQLRRQGLQACNCMQRKLLLILLFHR